MRVARPNLGRGRGAIAAILEEGSDAIVRQEALLQAEQEHVVPAPVPHFCLPLGLPDGGHEPVQRRLRPNERPMVLGSHQVPDGGHPSWIQQPRGVNAGPLLMSARRVANNPKLITRRRLGSDGMAMVPVGSALGDSEVYQNLAFNAQVQGVLR